jgi:hypothetical protein
MASLTLNPNIPTRPPASFFGPISDELWAKIPTADDGSKSDSPYISDQYEIAGIVASLDSCWLNSSRECVKPSRDIKAYSPVQNRPKYVTLDDGTEGSVLTAVMAFQGGHVPDSEWSRIQASTTMGSWGRWAAIKRFYEGKGDPNANADQIENCFAAVRLYVDEKRGAIVYHGVVQPHRTDADVEVMRSAAVSGDWIRLSEPTASKDRVMAGLVGVISNAFKNSIKTTRLMASFTPDLEITGMDDNQGPERVLMGASGPIELEHVDASVETLDDEVVAASTECLPCVENENRFKALIESMPTEAIEWMRSLSASTGVIDVVDQTPIVEAAGFEPDQEVIFTDSNGVPKIGFVGPKFKLLGGESIYAVDLIDGTQLALNESSLVPSGRSRALPVLDAEPVVEDAEPVVEETVEAAMLDMSDAKRKVMAFKLKNKLKKY